MTQSQSEDNRWSNTDRARQLEWVRKTLLRREPDYRFRWEVYFDRLEELARSASRFLDAGCGDNQTASELQGPRLRVGVDSNPFVGAYCNTPLPFPGTNPPGTTNTSTSSLSTNAIRIRGRLEALPFRDGSFDLIGCRHVVEHLDDPAAAFAELRRVMAPGGRLLIQTVNRSSPLIILSRLLGMPLRRWLSRCRYRRTDADPFPVRDRFNVPALFESPPSGFRFVSLEMTQDVDLQSRIGFWLSYALVLWTRKRPQRRSMITAEWMREP